MTEMILALLLFTLISAWSQTILKEDNRMSNPTDTISDSEGETPFNFEKWIKDNSLNDIKYIFIKHNMQTTDALLLHSVAFTKFVSDPELITKHSSLISVAVTAIQKLNTLQNNNELGPVIYEQEEIVMDNLQLHIESLAEIEKALRKCKAEHPKSIQRIKNVKREQIKHTINKVNKTFNELHNALNIKQQILLKQLENMDNDIKQEQKCDDNKEDDVLSNSLKTLHTEQEYLLQKLQKCKNIIKSSTTKDTKEKRKQNIKNIGEQAKNRFNKTVTELNKTVEMLKDKIDKNNKLVINIDFIVHSKKYAKILSKINDLGVIATDPSPEPVKEDEDDLLIHTLKNEIKNQKQSMVNSLSFDINGKYRWYINEDEKEANIQIGMIHEDQKSIVVDGLKKDISNNKISIKPAENEDITKYVSTLKQNMIYLNNVYITKLQSSATLLDLKGGTGGRDNQKVYTHKNAIVTSSQSVHPCTNQEWHIRHAFNGQIKTKEAFLSVGSQSTLTFEFKNEIKLSHIHIYPTLASRATYYTNYNIEIWKNETWNKLFDIVDTTKDPVGFKRTHMVQEMVKKLRINLIKIGNSICLQEIDFFVFP
eukprot:235658_1